MFGIWLVFACSCGLFVRSREKNTGQRKLFYISCGIVVLNTLLYGVTWFYPHQSCFHLSLVLFFLQGFGLMQLLQTTSWIRYLHLVPFVLFALLYAFYDELVGISVLNQKGIVCLGILSFYYANYGYWCLIKGRFYRTTRRFTAFYIVLLYCMSLLFLILYFYQNVLFDSLRFMFVLVSSSLLFGILLYEVSLLLSLRNKKREENKGGELNVFNQRLFGKIAVYVSQSSAKDTNEANWPRFSQIPVVNAVDSAIRFDDKTRLEITAIRAILTEKLIDTQLFLNPTLNLDQLADLVQVGKSDLIRFFKASQAVSFKQYINRLKVEHAIVLIREREETYTVEELSFLCGFNTRLSFYRAFVDVYGFAPSEMMGK